MWNVEKIDYLLQLQHKPYDVIVANGLFPNNPALLQKIKDAQLCVACDGAISKLLAKNLNAHYVIGDGDSINKKIITNKEFNFIQINDQNTNDLTKAIHFLKTEQKTKQLLLIGTTGLREDHTLANIGILFQHTNSFQNIAILSDFGVFTIYGVGQHEIKTFQGQQISLFANHPHTQVSTQGLKWELTNTSFSEWNQGSLNMAVASNFKIDVKKYPLLVYRAFEIYT